MWDRRGCSKGGTVELTRNFLFRRSHLYSKRWDRRCHILWPRRSHLLDCGGKGGTDTVATEMWDRRGEPQRWDRHPSARRSHLYARSDGPTFLDPRQRRSHLHVLGGWARGKRWDRRARQSARKGRSHLLLRSRRRSHLKFRKVGPTRRPKRWDRR